MQITLHTELQPLFSMTGKITENISQIESIDLKFVLFCFEDSQHFGADWLNDTY